MHTTVQIVQKLSPGGIETIALDFAKHTQKNELNYIISLEGSREEMVAKWPRLNEFREQIFFLNKPAKFCLKTVFRLAKLIKRLKANCVHTHHIGPFLYGGIAAKIARTRKHIHTEHDVWHLENKKHQVIQKVLLTICRPKVIADSDMVANQLKDKLGVKKVSTILNGIDTKKFTIGSKDSARARLNLPKKVTLIGCAGRLETVKGQSVLLNALTHLPEHVHMALAGVGSMEQELKALTKQLNLTERVHFLGLVEDMPGFYQSLDLFCLPSYNEGFPLSPLEAQSCGIPCVITDTGASKEAICLAHGELVTTGDSLLMASKLTALLSAEHETSPDITAFNDNKEISNEVRDFVINIASIDLMLGAYRTLKLKY